MTTPDTTPTTPTKKTPAKKAAPRKTTTPAVEIGLRLKKSTTNYYLVEVPDAPERGAAILPAYIKRELLDSCPTDAEGFKVLTVRVKLS